MTYNMSTLPQLPNTLHYGGCQNPRTSRFSKKVSPGKQYKAQKRLETMVRLEAAGIGEGAAAAMLCISVPRLRTIKNSSDYLIVRMKITHGIILDHDASLTQIKEQRKEILQDNLPPALLVLFRELQRQPVTLAERKFQVEVAKDFLDREGSFAKISKTEVKPVDSWDYEKHDTQSASIIAAIRGTGASAPLGVSASTTESRHGEHSLEAVEANEAFSNSHTLSQTDQEEALARLEAEAAMLELPLKGLVN
jgi:hypothetical protein